MGHKRAIVHNIDEEQNKEIIDWHCIYGHVGTDILNKFGKKGISNSQCHECMTNNIKSHNAFRGSTTKYLVNTPFFKIHADLCFVTNGKGKSYGSATPYMLVIVDAYTDFKYVDFPKTKDQTGKCLSNFIALVHNFWEYHIKFITTDKGGEFTGGKSLEVILQSGIKLITTSGYSSKSNGKVEKLNQDIMNRVRPMLAQSGLTLDFWHYAALHTI